jgi:hypothetical protein
MYSDADHPANNDASDEEQIPILRRQSIHPDSLKFMDMAKELLDSPEIKQAISNEQQKPPQE